MPGRAGDAMYYEILFEHVGTWFCVFCKTLVPLRFQWSESGYFMLPDILRAFSSCALVTAELLQIESMLNYDYFSYIVQWGYCELSFL